MSRRNHSGRSKGTLERIAWVPWEDGAIMLRWDSPEAATVEAHYPYGRRSLLGVVRPRRLPPEWKQLVATRSIEMLRRRQPDVMKAMTPAEAALCQWAIDYPHLHEFLTAMRYEDGAERTPGTMTVFAGAEGGIKACINDKDSGEMAFTQGETFSELFMRIDAGLKDDRLDWRTAQRKGGKAKR